MSLSCVSGTPNIVNGFSHHALVQLPHWLCLCILTMPDTRLTSVQPGSRFTISTSPGVDSVTLHFTDKGTKPREVLHHMSEVIPLANSKLDSGLYMPRYFRKKMTWSQAHYSYLWCLQVQSLGFPFLFLSPSQVNSFLTKIIILVIFVPNPETRE